MERFKKEGLIFVGMSIVARLTSTYEKLGGNLNKLPKEIKYRILADEIAHPTLDGSSSYGKWLKLGTATLAATALAQSLPAIVHAEETPEKRHTEVVPDNLSLYNYLIDLNWATDIIDPVTGKAHRLRFSEPVEGSRLYAHIRFGKEGLHYTIKAPNYSEVARGFEPYKHVAGVLSFMREQERNSPEWQKFLKGFFRRDVPDYRKSVLEFVALHADLGQLPDDVIEQMQKGQAFARATPTPSTTLENTVKAYMLESKQGKIYITVDGNSVHYFSIDKKGDIEKGEMKKQGIPLTKAQEKVDAYLFKSEGTKKRENFKKWVLKVSPNVTADELGTIVTLMAEGFKPVFVGEYNEKGYLLGAQFTGYYSSDKTFEGALGLVFNKAIDKNSMTQVAGFYQVKYDARHDAIYGVVSGILAYKAGPFEISFYAAKSVTGKQKIKEEDKTDETTSSTTAGGNTTTRTTKVETKETTYRQPREVFKLTLKANAASLLEQIVFRFDDAAEIDRLKESPLYSFLEKLNLDLNAILLKGISGYVKESGDVKETREKVPDELKGRVGLEFLIGNMAGGKTTLNIRYEFGEGKSGYSVMVTWTKRFEDDDSGYIKKTTKDQTINLNQPAPTPEPIRKLEFKIKRETTTKSPEITSGACSTTGKEGESYSCIITYSGSTPTVITGHNDLSLQNTTATRAEYKGTFGFDASGTFPIKIRIRGSNGLDGFREYTLTVSDVNRNPSVTMDTPASNTTITAGQSVNFTRTASDPDGDSLTDSWTVTVVSGGAGPTINNVEDPGNVTFNNAGTYDIKDTVSDGKGGTASTVTRRITVNAPPEEEPGPQ